MNDRSTPNFQEPQFDVGAGLLIPSGVYPAQAN